MGDFDGYRDSFGWREQIDREGGILTIDPGVGPFFSHKDVNDDDSGIFSSS